MTPNTTTLSLALRHAALPALICLICLLAGCGNITQLHVADNSTAIVSARAVHRFGGGPGGGGLELEVSAVKARGEQQKRAGFRTVLAVPLQPEGKPIGVFILCCFFN